MRRLAAALHNRPSALFFVFFCVFCGFTREVKTERAPHVQGRSFQKEKTAKNWQSIGLDCAGTKKILFL
jgi:hypothetical protein